MLAVVVNRTFKIRGKKLAEYRKAAGLSQAMLGQRIGASGSLISKAERSVEWEMFHAKRQPLIDALKISSDVFNREIVIQTADAGVVITAGKEMPANLIDVDIGEENTTRIRELAIQQNLPEWEMVHAILVHFESLPEDRRRQLVEEYRSDLLKRGAAAGGPTAGRALRDRQGGPDSIPRKSAQRQQADESTPPVVIHEKGKTRTTKKPPEPSNGS